MVGRCSAERFDFVVIQVCSEAVVGAGTFACVLRLLCDPCTTELTVLIYVQLMKVVDALVKIVKRVAVGLIIGLVIALISELLRPDRATYV